jgi:hypothetical protein
VSGNRDYLFLHTQTADSHVVHSHRAKQDFAVAVSDVEAGAWEGRERLGGVGVEARGAERTYILGLRVPIQIKAAEPLLNDPGI